MSRIKRSTSRATEPDPPELTCAALDAALVYLPLLERPDFSPGVWYFPEGQFPYFALTDAMIGLVQVLSVEGLVYPFNWSAWQSEAKRYMDDPELLAHADLLTLRKLLTTHVRMDRFVEGHLGGMLEQGQITAILRRLRDIRRDWHQ